MRVAGFVGTVVGGLVGVVTLRGQGTEAHAQNPTADSATQQNMGVAAAGVQDPASNDQVEAPPDPVDETAPAAAAAEQVGQETILKPNLLDANLPGPTLEAGAVDQVQQTQNLVNMINDNPQLVDSINTHPDYFFEIWHKYPEFYQLCYEYPSS